MPNFTLILMVVGLSLFALILIGLILAKLYARASKEISFVRTGFGGQKVVMNGGTLVMPVLHEIIPVNMNTLRLEVRRTTEQALITRDRMRVDVQAEFYVRVKPTEDSIANAAQTLGKRTMDTKALKELVEGKFVDALRAVAAEMTLEELHEMRVDFVQKVQTAVTEDLLKNGLELETVSLTALDQTDQSFFNPQNLFDAQGLTKVTEEIEERRKQRNAIEQETEVAVRQKNLEAERQKLELAKEEEYAKLQQRQEIETRMAQQQSDIAMQQAEKERESSEAKIAAKREVDRAQIVAEREVEEARLQKEQQIREREIEKAKAVETAEIEQKKTVELAEQDRAIAIAEKSKAKSTAKAEADKALALAVRAEEQVNTARATEIAERQKAIELVEASKLAEREAIGVTTAAEAEKKAAESRAEALRLEAQAEADSEMVRAEAAKKRYEVEAEGKRAMHEAENVLTPAAIEMQVRMALIEKIETVVRESVRPLEAIESIKILQVDGLVGAANGNGGGNGAGGNGSGNVSDQIVNSALRYRGQAPLVDALLKELGLGSGSDLGGLKTLFENASAESSSTTAKPPADSGPEPPSAAGTTPPPKEADEPKPETDTAG